MRNKDIGYQLVFIGAILIICGIVFDIITIIFTTLLPFSFLAVILLVIGIIFVIIGGLKDGKKVDKSH